MGIVDDLISGYGLVGIFLASFLSYSIIPFPNEPVLVAGSSFFNPWMVLLIALVGANLGSVLSYYIGLKGLRTFFFKRSLKKESRGERMFERWGPLSIILFSWVPIIGDPLFIAAGVLRMRFWKMLLYSTIGKLWYFALVIWLTVRVA